MLASLTQNTRLVPQNQDKHLTLMNHSNCLKKVKKELILQPKSNENFSKSDFCGFLLENRE
jgi:hypothetical protein